MTYVVHSVGTEISCNSGAWELGAVQEPSPSKNFITRCLAAFNSTSACSCTFKISHFPSLFRNGLQVLSTVNCFSVFLFPSAVIQEHLLYLALCSYCWMMKTGPKELWRCFKTVIFLPARHGPQSILIYLRDMQSVVQELQAAHLKFVFVVNITPLQPPLPSK